MEQDPKEPVRNSKFVVREDGDDTGDGVFSVNDAGKETRISDPIRHLGNASRADGSGSSDVIRFRDRNRELQEIIIPHTDSVIDTRKMFYALADKGFAVPTTKEGRDQLASYLAECRQSPKKAYLLAERMGWHGLSFVIGKKVISTDASQALKLTGRISAYAEKFGQGGILDQYQSKVLKRASYSSRLMAGIALALLAPLARILSLENGGLNIVGKAGIGKTTILRVAGSFYGGGPKPYFVPWNMADNALATLGLAFCDLPLLLDELDTLEPDSSKAGGRLKTIVHRLAMGQGKTRSHHASTEDSNSTDFHVVYGSTSEHRLPDFMREGGSQVTVGQAARFVDLPADAGNGFKIFESLPIVTKTRKPFDVDRYLVLLNKACQSYYGVAGRLYLRRLVNDLATDPSTLKAFLDKETEAFEDKVAYDTQVDHRIRRRFAGLYAAGQLGLHYGILPPRCDWFMDAIASCYWAANALDSNSLLSATEAGVCLAKFIKANRDQLLKIKEKEAITQGSYQLAVGLVPNPDRHGKRVWVKSKVIQKSVFPTGTFESAVTELVKLGVIVLSSRGLVAQQQRVPVLGIKEYFYVVDAKKLSGLNKNKGRS